MSIFTLQSVKKDFGIKEILKDASFSLDATDKVGLIGTNGSGKSTLLKIANNGEAWLHMPVGKALDDDDIKKINRYIQIAINGVLAATRKTQLTYFHKV